MVSISQRADANLPGVKKVVYKPKRAPSPHTHHYIRETEAGVLNAQQVARAALTLRDSGFVPDVMLGHNGWGEIWYLKDVFPKTPLIGYFEFFYRNQGADVDFGPSIAEKFDTAPRVRTKNLGNHLGLEAVDLGQCPTRWQQSLYSERYHSMLRVVHEGVDTRSVVPNPNVRLRTPGCDRELTPKDEILTYVARNLEPYRGFISFMRSLPSILTRRPNARVLIVGGNEVSYGPRLSAGKTFKEQMLAELGDSLDLSRIHFLGKVPYPTFLGILQISRAHIYLRLRRTLPSHTAAVQLRRYHRDPDKGHDPDAELGAMRLLLYRGADPAQWSEPGPRFPAHRMDANVDALVEEARTILNSKGCPPAPTAYEWAVCLPNMLRQADAGLTERYRTVLKSAGQSAPRLQLEQSAWIRERDQRCGLRELPGVSQSGRMAYVLASPSKAVCTIEAMRERASRLGASEQ